MMPMRCFDCVLVRPLLSLGLGLGLGRLFLRLTHWLFCSRLELKKLELVLVYNLFLSHQNQSFFML